jgi:hypothetical protein
VDETKPIQFAGGMTANARIADHLGWRGIDLLGRDCWLVADDEIALDYRPLAAAFECHLKTAERTRHRFRASARQHRTVDRDWLPPTYPLAECGHDREFG